MPFFAFPLDRPPARVLAAYGWPECPDVRAWQREGLRVWEGRRGGDLNGWGAPSFEYPLARGTYRISSPYGYRISPISKTRKMHNGIDMAAPEGTPIYASADGQVVTVFTDHKVNGNGVILAHEDGYRTAYIHMSRRRARQGQRVKQGELIGWVGSTGQSTGPHLHFILYKKGGGHTDPAPYLNPMSVKGAALRVRRVWPWVLLTAALVVGGGIALDHRRRRRQARWRAIAAPPRDYGPPMPYRAAANPPRRRRRRRRGSRRAHRGRYPSPVRPNG